MELEAKGHISITFKRETESSTIKQNHTSSPGATIFFLYQNRDLKVMLPRGSLLVSSRVCDVFFLDNF